MSKHFDALSLSFTLLQTAISTMDKFFNDVQKANKKPAAESDDASPPEKKALPKGVVLGKDGKPCVDTFSPYPHTCPQFLLQS